MYIHVLYCYTLLNQRCMNINFRLVFILNVVRSVSSFLSKMINIYVSGKKIHKSFLLCLVFINTSDRSIKMQICHIWRFFFVVFCFISLHVLHAVVKLRSSDFSRDLAEWRHGRQLWTRSLPSLTVTSVFFHLFIIRVCVWGGIFD